MSLVRGGYPVTYQVKKLLGSFSELNQSNITPRTNGEWFGFGGLSDSSLAGTGSAVVVPVPVETGDVISRVSYLAGATAGATLTHQFAAVYSGAPVPALLGQSPDSTAASVSASGRVDFALGSPVLISAPGIVYVALVYAGGTVPSAVSASTPTATQYQWFPNGPLFEAATFGTGLTTTAPPTITGQTVKATAPLVFLS